MSDTNQLAALNSEPQLAAGQYSETDLGPFDLQDECGPAVWNEEETLDVAAVHSMAPGANIHYVGAQDCDTGIDAAINNVLQHHSADIVSNSYGDTGEDGLGDEVALEHSLFLQAALEGIGFYFSSGDDGDDVIDGLPHPEPDYPSSDPLVTSVGGTDLAVNSANGYLFETSWGDDSDSVDFSTSPSSYAGRPLPGDFLGGGGGVSALFTEPLYQRLAVPRLLAASLNGATPRCEWSLDVAAVADPETGFEIVFQGAPRRSSSARYEPGGPGVRRLPGRRQSASTVGDRLRQPAALPPGARQERVPRRHGTSDASSDDDPDRPAPPDHGAGLVVDRDPRLRRHHRSRNADCSSVIGRRSALNALRAGH